MGGRLPSMNEGDDHLESSHGCTKHEETMRPEIKSLKEVIEEGRCATSSGDREARNEAPKPPVFKATRNA